MAADSERIDGAAIAAERIARKAVERTGSLDLGMLGLTALPEALSPSLSPHAFWRQLINSQHLNQSVFKMSR